MNSMEAKETITKDGITYNLHLFAGSAGMGNSGSLEYFSDDESVYADCGLWIEDGELVDYDGCYALPPVAVNWLRAHGVKVPSECTYNDEA